MPVWTTQNPVLSADTLNLQVITVTMPDITNGWITAPYAITETVYPTIQKEPMKAK